MIYSLSMEMYENEELPATLEWYKDQIAGHHPSVVKNGIRQIGIVKERGKEQNLLKLVQDGMRGISEVQFYDSIFQKDQSNHTKAQAVALEGLRNFVPHYFGKRVIEIASRSYEFIELEDITYPFKKPCIMDIKIGKVTYDPDASEDKKYTESIKCPHQKEFGFRILGYRLHPDEKGQVRVQDKNWGRTRTPENIQAAFNDYFQAIPTPKLKSDAIKIFRKELSKISEWFDSQQEIQMYSSSLLFVYEGDPHAQTHAKMKMIDFSHVFYEKQLDENYIHGLKFIDNVFHCIEMSDINKDKK
jgi:1D-myo-inositol-tetrakisphosphate 5-kinase/inositol-polyphosphate multikinase